MHDNRTHPLLQQVPLTVSPFVTLPSATTLPYQYRPLPSALPPSLLTAPTTADSDPKTSNEHGAPATSGVARYVVSASGHSAHPNEILASCRALHAHVAELQAKAERDLAEITERIRARELAEKRRVAPGWLDSEARLLEPERAGGTAAAGVLAAGGAGMGGGVGGAGQGQMGGGNVEMGGGQEGMMVQQPVEGFGTGAFGGAFGGDRYGTQYQGGPGGASEMAVPDEGEEMHRAFRSLQLGKS
ncbi:hypothetical protein C8A05DRAFT_45588 [Staphylotrichum tortipilum]|uniref:Uncharacterized protein n=1 Tax=Staphylotrichum tortipilum TaxID=2831512 RepID=A0AAN6MI80_9PEZI|nr:hypothetical protein C8A05DRAFT_45588 [Staphylotrichum longicolle]